MRRPAVAAMLVLATGCAPAVVRRAALVPDGYLPALSGAPLDRHEIRVSGEVAGSDDWMVREPSSFSAAVGVPGVYLPRLHVGGSLAANVATYKHLRVDLAAQGTYTSYLWSRPNVTGVPPMPASVQNLYWVGGALRLLYTDAPFFWGTTFQLDISPVPEAVYVNGKLQYTDVDTFALPSFFLQGGWRGEHVTFYGLGGVQSGVLNTGFSSSYQTAGEDTLASYALFNLGVGAQYRLGHAVFDFIVSWPLSFNYALEFGPMATLRVGLGF